jgi:hypothetical protein
MKKPWDINPDLEEDRLIAIASFISDVRAEVVELHDEVLGDTNKSLGFRAYECCRSRITSESLGSGNWPWLKVITAEGRFTFAIGKTPVRFYRGVPTSIEERRLVKSLEASSQLSLLEVSTEIAAINWWFAVEVDEFKYADKVTFVGFNEEGIQVCLWDVPLQVSVSSLSAIDAISKPEAIKQSKPQVKLKSDEKNKKRNDKE